MISSCRSYLFSSKPWYSPAGGRFNQSLSGYRCWRPKNIFCHNLWSKSFGIRSYHKKSLRKWCVHRLIVTGLSNISWLDLFYTKIARVGRIPLLHPRNSTDALFWDAIPDYYTKQNREKPWFQNKVLK